MLYIHTCTHTSDRKKNPRFDSSSCWPNSFHPLNFLGDLWSQQLLCSQRSHSVVRIMLQAWQCTRTFRIWVISKYLSVCCLSFLSILTLFFLITSGRSIDISHLKGIMRIVNLPVMVTAGSYWYPIFLLIHPVLFQKHGFSRQVEPFSQRPKQNHPSENLSCEFH